ncbi:hypothetical protein QTN93_12330 [Sphingomonas aerolata]|uniref:hypothetical protein n=1 Tax=Sphingomonas aerolata TaxID=185951 RepID=UPI0035A6CF22
MRCSDTSRSNRARTASEVERTGDRAIRAPAQRQCDPRARRDRAGIDRLRDQRRCSTGVTPADARADQHPVERIALTQCRGKVDAWPFGGLRERYDKVVRRHPPPRIRALAERRDRQRPRLFACRTGQRRGDAAGQLAKTGGEHDGRGAQRGAGREAAPPRRTTDRGAQIGHPVDPRRGVVQPRDAPGKGAGTGGGGAPEPPGVDAARQPQLLLRP